MNLLSYLFATLCYAGLWYGDNGKAFSQPISIPFRVIVPQCDENGDVIWDPSEPACLDQKGKKLANPASAKIPPLYHPSFAPPSIRSYMSVSNELNLYLDQLVGNLVPSEEVLKLLYVPKVAVVTGGSRGIGHAVACNLAGLQVTKDFQDAKVISLSKRDPDFECDGVTYINFDISSSEDSKWDEVDEALGDSSIDFLLLNAGYDAVGSMRDTRNDLERVFANNVWGNHDVWVHLHEELDPSFSVVLGVSSIAGKVANFFFKRQPYAFTKAMLEQLILAYAHEESVLHPNTRYGSVIQGDAKSKFALTTLIPETNEMNSACNDQFVAYGTLSNSYITQFGMELADVAEQYHKIYALYGLIKDGVFPNLAEMPPQRFSVAGGEGFDEVLVDVGMYNTNVLRPEATLKCYSNTWDKLRGFFENSCPLPPGYEPTCTGLEFLAPFLDPRTETCAAV